MADHMASTAEAITHLRRLSLQAVAMQPIAGSDVGTISVSVNYANNANHASSIQLVQADSGWQDFWAKSTASAASTLVEFHLRRSRHRFSAQHRPATRCHPCHTMASQAWTIGRFRGQRGDVGSAHRAHGRIDADDAVCDRSASDDDAHHDDLRRPGRVRRLFRQARRRRAVASVLGRSDGRPVGRSHPEWCLRKHQRRLSPHSNQRR
jgi:hypothetical protein